MSVALGYTLTGLAPDAIDRLARNYAVPLEDALLIAINLCGIGSEEPRHRARLSVRLNSAPGIPWTVIVPLNVSDSPFRLRGNDLLLGDQLVAHVEAIDVDEAVGGYFRNSGRAATLNPNARSRCVGCAFCPNTLEAAADPRLARDHQLGDLLAALAQQNGTYALRDLTEVTVSTGCFERESLALEHLRALRANLSLHDMDARIGFLTSVIRSTEGFDYLADKVSPFILRLTVECFERRDLLLKSTKASLAFDDMSDLLQRAHSAGLATSFTYVVGLDDLGTLSSGIAQLAPHTTDFPNLQVYQAHNRIMAGLRAPGAEALEFYLQARRIIEDLFGPTGLRPKAWECYRPLWYFSFGSEALVHGA